ncbi:hypothetical protein PVAND_015407 [Polypedilum vanderplanki]|uniref:Uncharacterized protein n=1 Tax=Polypedilum vanderplanki TaxID=319348 RepID=A0A9J6BD11_POLVA|nr:hypothetical protein PVAND_015407 [Polypedilum vanderplanki]
MLEKAKYIPVSPKKSQSKAKTIMTILTASIAAFILVITIVSVYSSTQSPVEVKKTTPKVQKDVHIMLDPTYFSKNQNGVEIPFKLVSITPIKYQKKFYASVFVKFPKDLIDNEGFVVNLLYDIEDNFEDAIDKATNGEKMIYAHLHTKKKKYDEIIMAIYIIEFITGVSTNEDFMTLYKTSFLDFVDEYYKIIDREQNVKIREVTTDKNLAYTVETESDEVQNTDNDINIAEDRK